MKEEKKTPILVSACLLGAPCRYDGASKAHPAVAALAARSDLRLIPICPEMDGGLGTPRIPAERRGACVVNAVGEDVSVAYWRGAERACRLAREEGCAYALLKEHSPSCGSRFIYDGSFTGKTVMGQGVCSELLREEGVLVFSEESLEGLLSRLDGDRE